MQTWGDLGATERNYVPSGPGGVRERRGVIASRVRAPTALTVWKRDTSWVLGLPRSHLVMPTVVVDPSPDGLGIERLDVTVPNLRGTASWAWPLVRPLPWWSLAVGAAETSETDLFPSTVTVSRLAEWTWDIQIAAPAARDRVESWRPTGRWQFAAAEANWQQVRLSWQIRSGPRHLRGDLAFSGTAFPIGIRKSRFNGDEVAGRVSRLAYIRRTLPIRGFQYVASKGDV